jgi:hypothetical protein
MLDGTIRVFPDLAMPAPSEAATPATAAARPYTSS